MMAGSHVLLGVAAWTAVAPHVGVSALEPVPLALAVSGALLPDIDHPKSWVGRRAGLIAGVVGRLFGHRGITHSLLALAGCVWLAGHRSGLPVAVGYLSHLGADLLTPGGLRLAWPLRRTWSVPLCRTGSARETGLAMLLAAALWLGPGGGSAVLAHAGDKILGFPSVTDLGSRRSPHRARALAPPPSASTSARRDDGARIGR